MEVNNSIVSIYLVYIQDNKRAKGSGKAPLVLERNARGE